MRVTCKVCGAVYPVSPPPWVVSSGRPFRMDCARCGASQEVVPTGLAVFDEGDVADAAADHDGLPRDETQEASFPGELAMPVFAPLRAGASVAAAPDDLPLGAQSPYVLDPTYDVEGERGTLLPFEDPPDTEVEDTGTHDALSELGHSFHAPPRFVLRQGGSTFDVGDLAAVQRWIVEGRLRPDDVLSEDGGTWHAASSRPELGLFFAAVRRLEAADGPVPAPERGAPAAALRPPPRFDAAPVGAGPVLAVEPRGPVLGDDDAPGSAVAPYAASAAYADERTNLSSSTITPRPSWSVGAWATIGVGVGLLAVLGIVLASQPAAPAAPVVPPRVDVGAAVPVEAPPLRQVPPEQAPPRPAAKRTAPPPASPGAPDAAAVPAVRARVEAPPARPAVDAPADAALAPPDDASVETLVDLGWQAVDGNDLAGAFRAFERAVGLDAGSAAANYGLGYILLQRGRVTQARPYLCRAAPRATGSDATEIARLIADNGITCR